jgi:hypothetical protein
MNQDYIDRQKQKRAERAEVLEHAKRMGVTIRAKGGMAGVQRVEMDVRELARLLDRLEGAEAALGELAGG